MSWSTDTRLAVRYSPPGTPIDVMIVPGTHLTEIVVADRGPGVSETDLERIFTPLDRRSARATEGAYAP